MQIRRANFWTFSKQRITFSRWGFYTCAAYSRCGQTRAMYSLKIVEGSLVCDEMLRYMMPKTFLALLHTSWICCDQQRLCDTITSVLRCTAKYSGICWLACLCRAGLCEYAEACGDSSSFQEIRIVGSPYMHYVPLTNFLAELHKCRFLGMVC